MRPYLKKIHHKKGLLEFKAQYHKKKKKKYSRTGSGTQAVGYLPSKWKP
jgi:hypothetical protein